MDGDADEPAVHRAGLYPARIRPHVQTVIFGFTDVLRGGRDRIGIALRALDGTEQRLVLSVGSVPLIGQLRALLAGRIDRERDGFAVEGILILRFGNDHGSLRRNDLVGQRLHGDRRKQQKRQQNGSKFLHCLSSFSK